MNDMLKKMMLTGIGVAAVSKDKIEEMVKEMISRGKITEQEGKKFVEEMVGYAEKTRADLEKQVNAYLEKAIDRMDLVRKRDLEELQGSILEIKKRLEEKEQNED